MMSNYLGETDPMCETGTEKPSAGYLQFAPAFGDISGNPEKVHALPGGQMQT